MYCSGKRGHRKALAFVVGPSCQHKLRYCLDLCAVCGRVRGCGRGLRSREPDNYSFSPILKARALTMQELQTASSPQILGVATYPTIYVTSATNTSLKVTATPLSYDSTANQWTYQFNWSRTRNAQGSLYVTLKANKAKVLLAVDPASQTGTQTATLAPATAYRVEFYTQPATAGTLLLRKFFTTLSSSAKPSLITMCPNITVLCPDGKTTVGYTGPNCQLLPCPGSGSPPPITVNPPLNSLVSCNINFTDTDDPHNAEYLGPNIYPLIDSDWMHDSGIINQVDTLIAGKNDDMSKAVAIASWVEQSRPYDFALDTSSSSPAGLTPANNLQSVIDIYNEKTGICLDAAVITTAMFRLAGIPARIAMPVQGAAHANTQAYINGQWLVFNSTFGAAQGKPVGVTVDFPPMVYSYFRQLDNQSAYSAVSLQPGDYFGTELYKGFDTANASSVFGTVTIANVPTNGNLYASDSLAGDPLMFNITRTDGKDLYYVVVNNQINYVISSSQPPSIPVSAGLAASYTKFNYVTILPQMRFLQVSNNGESNVAVNLVSAYRHLETFNLPLGGYRITYHDNNTGQDIAYADFTVTQGGTANLTADKFTMASGANQQNYNYVINRLNSTWANCANNPLQ